MTRILENLYKKYSRKKFIPPDPLQFVYHFSKKQDMEIAAFLSAALAYGRVEQIEKSLSRLFEIIPDPYDFVMKLKNKCGPGLNAFKHRFNTGQNIFELLKVFQRIYKKYDTMEDFFLLGYKRTDRNVLGGLENYCGGIYDIYREIFNKQPDAGFGYLAVSPAAGSACKRMNLFLRWMVRDDRIDTGLWKRVQKSGLIVPVDVHMARLSAVLGFHDKKTITLKTAVHITRRFAQIVPDDPVKYDFSLCRIGILEDCTGKMGSRCEDCELFGLCMRKKNETS